jgi:Type IX secretion system protein PorV
MKKHNLFHIAVLVFVICFSQNLFGQENTKIAQTGFQFLTVGTDARATSLGEAYTTTEGTSNAMFYNPAGMARLNSFVDFSINRMDWIADITYLSGTIGFDIEDGKYGIFGLSFQYVDYGEFLFTRVAPNDAGYVDIDGFPEPYSFSIGLGYAKALSDKFSIGGQIKYATQNLGNSYLPATGTDDDGKEITVFGEEKEYEIGVLAFDFGTLYKTGYKSLAFGMSVRNFAEEVKYEKEGFQLPLVFKIGISMDLVDFYDELKDNHSLVLSVDAAHPRSHPEYIAVGGEYVFMNIVSFRAGYVSGQDLYDFTAGFGVKQFGLEVNYSYTPFIDFEDVHRISLGFGM